ncbi:MAG: NUDIX domain-containing protein, partial [Candidatus Nanohaloarchaea archaeon]
HVEEGELPHQTALRETREETGWRVEILEQFVPDHEYGENSKDVPRPFNINLHRIEEGHWHCDMQFVARPIEKVEATHEHEHDGQEWFSTTEIDDLDAPENLRAAAMKALELTT